MKIKTFNISDLDYSVVTTLCQSTIPLTVSVTVINMDDPHDVSHTAVISVVTDRMMKHFLASHYSWKFLFMDEEIATNETETYFSYIWNDFVVRHKDDIEKAVQAEQMEYNPALTFFRDESGDSDKITYNSTAVTNAGGIASATSRAGKTVSDSMGTADTEGYREASVGTAFSAGVKPSNTTTVSTYDDDDFKNLTKSESDGDSATLSGSTSSSKLQNTGDDTHSRDMHFEGSDALHTSTQMVEAEVDMRLGLHIGRRVLNMFADEYLFMDE